MFVFEHLFPDISIKSTKLHFQSWRKISPTILLFFRKMTAEVSRNNCALIYFRHLKVSWVNAKPFSLVRGYIEVKINTPEIWLALTQLSLRCLKYIKAQLFLDTSAVFLRKKSETVGKIFSSSGKAIWSILPKYQEIDAQI